MAGEAGEWQLLSGVDVGVLMDGRRQFTVGVWDAWTMEGTNEQELNKGQLWWWSFSLHSWWVRYAPLCPHCPCLSMQTTLSFLNWPWLLLLPLIIYSFYTGKNFQKCKIGCVRHLQEILKLIITGPTHHSPLGKFLDLLSHHFRTLATVSRPRSFQTTPTPRFSYLQFPELSPGLYMMGYFSSLGFQLTGHILIGLSYHSI